MFKNGLWPSSTRREVIAAAKQMIKEREEGRSSAWQKSLPISRLSYFNAQETARKLQIAFPEDLKLMRDRVRDYTHVLPEYQIRNEFVNGLANVLSKSNDAQADAETYALAVYMLLRKARRISQNPELPHLTAKRALKMATNLKLRELKLLGVKAPEGLLRPAHVPRKIKPAVESKPPSPESLEIKEQEAQSNTEERAWQAWRSSESERAERPAPMKHKLEKGMKPYAPSDVGAGIKGELEKHSWAYSLTPQLIERIIEGSEDPVATFRAYLLKVEKEAHSGPEQSGSHDGPAAESPNKA